MSSSCPRRLLMPSAEKIESLQVGRGVAALLVVLVHVTTFIHLNYKEVFAANSFIAGSAGVDFFFVLSGFIIWHRHARDIGHPERAISYGWRRFVRIYPAYWIVTLAILPAYFLVPKYGQGDETTPYVISTSLLLLPATRSPLLVAGWTLIHELWFYLLFAGLIAVRGSLFRWVVGVWGCGVAAFVIGVGDTRSLVHPWLRTIFQPVNFEFIFGCLAAWIVTRGNHQSARAWLGLLAAGLVAFAWCFFARPLGFEFRAGRVMTFGFSSFLIVLGAAGWELSTRRRPAAAFAGLPSALVFLGDASYALYLLHGPVLSLTCKVAAATGLLRSLGTAVVGWLAVVVCVLAACAFHQWLEKPLLRWLRRGGSGSRETAPTTA